MKKINYDILSKTISHALRHEPSLYGLELDEEGWAELDKLINALRKYNRWRVLEESDVMEMNAQSAKQRFEINKDKIRALYGHSGDVKIRKTEAVPPHELFHGTSAQNAGEIIKNGLKAMERQFVHLSTDAETAKNIALRKTNKPVILQIDALLAEKSGIAFYTGNNDVWLSEEIPPSFIKYFLK